MKDLKKIEKKFDKMDRDTDRDIIRRSAILYICLAAMVSTFHFLIPGLDWYLLVLMLFAIGHFNNVHEVKHMYPLMRESGAIRERIRTIPLIKTLEELNELNKKVIKELTKALLQTKLDELKKKKKVKKKKGKKKK